MGDLVRYLSQVAERVADSRRVDRDRSVSMYSRVYSNFRRV